MTKLKSVLDNALSKRLTYSTINGDNPYLISIDGVYVYVYLRQLSSAYFENKNITRAQLPIHPDFNEIKTSNIPFVFLGYDWINDVFATWSPEHVKNRLNKATYISLYSRQSLQDKAGSSGNIQRSELTNGETVVVIPQKLLYFYLTNIEHYFPKNEDHNYDEVGNNEENTIVEESQVNYVVETNEENNINKDLIDKDGKLIAITNPDLIDKLRPVLDIQYPSKMAALNIIGDFYGEEYKDTMDFKDWMILINNINWDNPYDLPDNNSTKIIRIGKGLRKKIKVVTPQGKIIFNQKVVDTFIDVVKYAGIERIYKQRIKAGNKRLIVDESKIDDQECYRCLTKNLYIYVKLNTETKFRILKDINNKFNLGLTISLVF